MNHLEGNFDELEKTLTADEIKRLVPKGVLSRAATRNRSQLSIELKHVEHTVKLAIMSAAKDKMESRVLKAERKRKRKVDSRRETRRVAARAEASGGGEAAEETCEGVPMDIDEMAGDGFLSLPTDDERKACLEAFIQRTSNAALKMNVCVACAREMSASEGKIRALGDLPNQRRLYPEAIHPQHTIWNGMLLLVEKTHSDSKGTHGWVCGDCFRSLEGDRIPRLALANGMWIGQIPDVLRHLSIPEQMLIARQ